MKKKVLGFMCVSVLGMTQLGLAADKKPIDPQKLKENFARLQDQNIVVQVLAAQYNKELAELKRTEAIFCDFYNLDVELWRQNKYRWDEKSGQFILKEDTDANKNPKK